MCKLSFRILDDDYDRVTPEEQLRYVSLLVLRPGALALALLRHLGPHLEDAFKHHVHVAIESFDIAEQLPVVATVDQHLAIGLYCFGQESQGALIEDLLVGRMLSLFVLRFNHFLSLLTSVGDLPLQRLRYFSLVLSRFCA